MNQKVMAWQNVSYKKIGFEHMYYFFHKNLCRRSVGKPCTMKIGHETEPQASEPTDRYIYIYIGQWDPNITIELRHLISFDAQGYLFIFDAHGYLFINLFLAEALGKESDSFTLRNSSFSRFRETF